MKNTSHTLSFTGAEKVAIQRAATICGWRNAESATFARAYLLRGVAAILKGDRLSRTPGARLLARVRYFKS
jgi:hypothetical protein